jgi:hypothetical protein
MIALILLSAIVLPSGALMLAELRNAPEGYEDESGFHPVQIKDAPNQSEGSPAWVGPAYAEIRGLSVQAR